MLPILVVLLAAQLSEARYLKPNLETITMPSVQDLKYEIQRHTLQNAEIGNTISIKMVPFARVELLLHANRLGASEVVPLSITFRPKDKSLLFNSLVNDEYDYEERKYVPFNTYEEIQLDIHLQESQFFIVIDDFYQKFFAYPFQFEKLQFLTLKGYSLLMDVQESTPKPEVTETELPQDVEMESSGVEEPSQDQDVVENEAVSSNGAEEFQEAIHEEEFIMAQPFSLGGNSIDDNTF